MRRPALTTAAVTLLAACGGAEAADDAATTAAAEPAPVLASAAPVAAAATVDPQELPAMVVYKTEGCGCCNGWVEHLQEAGFTVDARNVRNLMGVKIDAGVPTNLSSCHTAIIDGYVVEGHVPEDVIRKLLTERPDVAGIAVAGMPIGSPGMEGPNAKPYQVHAFTRDGTATVYAEVDPR